ncbi:spore cortex biosynthesis protein YabQ [Desmospora profundinema]|uniref:Spore cortex biosynthesis protein YabQ n=1 Tax=Desmospora profundinema TaxID=1571184 RepID=A0ABU1IQL8_9BACL|nr:spore cortex biosynthesis protein YabQ [Desmospora profundinema]MDR6227097.1 spore cortex biosynthesis protein YabQ [Desmospora profundinema]
MTLYTQWVTMGLMLSSGCLMGLMLDLYRVLKTRFHMRGWVVSFVDLLYWTVAAGMVFGLLFWSNWGELRLPVLVAIAAGWFTYHIWFSRLATRVLRALLAGVETLCRWVLRILYVCLWLPLAALWMLLYRVFIGLVQLLWAALRFPLWILSPVFRWLQPLREGLVQGARPVIRRFRRWIDWLRRWFPGQRNDGE